MLGHLINSNLGDSPTKLYCEHEGPSVDLYNRDYWFKFFNLMRKKIDFLQYTVEG